MNWEKERFRRKLKSYREKTGLAKSKLGVDVSMHCVDMMSKRALVGRLESVKLSREELQAWVSRFWVPEVGYSLHINLLINGWAIFIFLDEEKLSKI